MFSKLNNLNSLLNQCTYKILSDTPEQLSLLFSYAPTQSSDIYLDNIISILQLDTSCISLTTTTTQPSLTGKRNKHPFPQYIKEHFFSAIKLNSSSIEYIIKLDKKNFFNPLPNKNITWFLKLNSLETSFASPLKDNTEFLSKIFLIEKENIIITLNEDIYLKNDFTLISSLSKLNSSLRFINNTTNNTINSLDKKIELRKNCCSIEFSINHIVPDFFIFNYNSSNFICPQHLKILLNNLFILFLILYISNYSSIQGNTIYSKISTNKSIQLVINLDNLNIAYSNYEDLIQLYYLSYNSLNIQNIYLIRNMLTIYLCEDCNGNAFLLLFQKSNLILDSAKQNLHVMTIGNVEKYFTVRYSIYDFLDKSCEYIQSKISELTEKINKTFLSSIATFVGISFVYLKDRNLNILRLSILVYTIYILFDGILTLYSQYKQYKTFNKRYNNKLNYFKPILGNTDYNNITENNAVTKNLNDRFIQYWIIAIIFYSISFFVGLFSFFTTTSILDWLRKFLQWNF